MGSAAEALTHLVGDGAHVGSRGDAGAEVGEVGFDCGDGQFFYVNLNGLENNLFLFSRQLVGGDAVNFLGGEWWRDLLDQAAKFGGEGLEIVQSGADGVGWGERFTIG